MVEMKLEACQKRKLLSLPKDLIIKAAKKPRGSAVHIAKKKDGCPGFCPEKRGLNKQKRDKFPILNVEGVLDGMAGAGVFSKLISLLDTGRYGLKSRQKKLQFSDANTAHFIYLSCCFD